MSFTKGPRDVLPTRMGLHDRGHFSHVPTGSSINAVDRGRRTKEVSLMTKDAIHLV